MGNSKKTYKEKWQVIDQLYESGHSIVYLAANVDSEKYQPVILKLLKERDSPLHTERFRLEIAHLLKLQHPNIVHLIDFNLDVEPFIVTEYHNGGPLSNIDLTKFSNISRLRLFSHICNAIGYAHRNYIVHCDIKPWNIVMKDMSCPVVIDFGLSSSPHETGMPLHQFKESTEARYFTAPELVNIDSYSVTPSIDVYMLGKLLYWLLSGTSFSKEQYKEPDYDIRHLFPTVAQSEFVYEIFDQCIIAEPHLRLRDANLLFEKVEYVCKLI